MKTKVKSLEGMFFTNADPRYAGKLDDPQGGDAQNLRMRITVKPEVRNNAMTSVLIKPHLFWRLSSQISFETLKENSMMRSSKTRLKC